MCKTHSREKCHNTQIKYHITKWTNEYIMCEMVKDYKQLDSQYETKNNDPKPKTGLNKQKQLWWTENWTQQNGNESDDDHNQNEKCSELNCYQVMYPCRLTQVLILEGPITPYAISTLNIQINLLKTRRRRNCMCRMCRQGIGGHTWPDQVNHPWIDQILYRMMECWTMLSIVPQNLMIQAVLM